MPYIMQVSLGARMFAVKINAKTFTGKLYEITTNTSTMIYHMTQGILRLADITGPCERKYAI